MDKRRIKKIIKKYVLFLIQKGYKIEKVFLFGSIIKKTNTPDSDIDVAIIIKGIKNTYDILLELMKYRREFDTRIEPHIFIEKDFNKGNPLANDISNNGIKILF